MIALGRHGRSLDKALWRRIEDAETGGTRLACIAFIKMDMSLRGSIEWKDYHQSLKYMRFLPYRGGMCDCSVAIVART